MSIMLPFSDDIAISRFAEVTNVTNVMGYKVKADICGEVRQDKEARAPSSYNNSKSLRRSPI
jgi:hypothetical protein